MLAPWKGSYDKYRQHIEKQRHHLVDKIPYSQSHGFSGSHVQMWESDHRGRLRTEELMLSNCDAGEDYWEFLG